MSNHRIFHSALVASGIFLMVACASQPAGSLDEKYFQREANNYLKFEHEGQTLYCQNDRYAATVLPYKTCISETSLRQKVENARRYRNATAPAPGAGAGQGGIGWSGN